MFLPILLLSAACAPEAESGGGDACVDSTGVTWDSWGHGFFESYCDACHAAGAPDRHGAPDAAVFDDLAAVQAQVGPLRTVLLDEPSMPPGGGVTEADLARIADFLACPS
jgi:hypothetical protein